MILKINPDETQKKVIDNAFKNNIIVFNKLLERNLYKKEITTFDKCVEYYNKIIKIKYPEVNKTEESLILENIRDFAHKFNNHIKDNTKIKFITNKEKSFYITVADKIELKKYNNNINSKIFYGLETIDVASVDIKRDKYMLFKEGDVYKIIF